MSNFGRLGSAMVNDAVSVQGAMRRQDAYDSKQGQRDYDARSTELGANIREQEIDLAGGQAAYEKREAKRASQLWSIKQEQARLDVQEQKAKINKTNAYAAKLAMKSAAKVTKTGTSSYPVTKFKRPGAR